MFGNTVCIFLLLFCATNTALGQFNSDKNFFSVDQIAGCAPLQINLSLTDPLACDGSTTCIVDFLGTDQYVNLNAPTSYVYSVPGTYRLTVVIGASSGEDFIDIQVLPDTMPSLALHTCAGNEVYYQVKDNIYDAYDIDFNDGITTTTTSGIHSYASAGPQTVSIRGIHNSALDNCSPLNQTFNAVATLTTPVIDMLTVISPSEIQLDFTNESYTLYQLQMATNNSSTFVNLQEVYNQSSVVISTLDTENNYYCFRLGVVDPCNATISYSNVICSSILNLDLQNLSNNLSWTTDTNTPYFNQVNNYTIRRNSTNHFSNISKNLMAQNDLIVTCNVNYCYQLVINYANASQSYSQIQCGTTLSNQAPDPIEDISLVIDQNQITLQWIQPVGFTASDYIIYKSKNGSDYSNIGTTTETIFVDQYQANTTNCYLVGYTDECGNIGTPNQESCAIQLLATLQPDNSVALSWSPYTGWKDDVAYYRIEKYNQSGAFINSYTVGTSTEYDDLSIAGDLDNQVYYYKVIAIPMDGVLVSAISNQVTVIKDPNLSHPQAFTPNNDNLNDTFLVYGQFITDFNLKIFNRWGEMVFVSSNMGEGWDGKLHGKLLPEGTYVFKADLVDLAGRTLNYSGPFTLLWKK